MKSYKKVLPYVLAAAPLAMTSCVEGRVETGIVLHIDDKQLYYCDKDSDGLADYRFFIGNHFGRSCVQDYIQVGDTVSFEHYAGTNIVGGSLIINAMDIKSVNGRSYEELVRIYNVNNIRKDAGQQKMR